jgi:hypothetical protein
VVRVIVSRHASEALAIKALEFRGRGEVVNFPSERWPKHPWCVVDG